RNPQLGVKLAQAFAFVGDYCAQTDEERDTLYYAGLEIAERTLALHEPFRMHMIRTQEEDEALGKVVRQINFDKRNKQAERSRHWLAAIYWLSVNLERWTDSQNSLRRLGNKKRIELYKRAVLEVDETFDYGGVYRSSRVVPMKPPYVGAQSLREGFERALEIAPDYFANHTAYARHYALPENKAELFREHLEYAINNDANKLPAAHAENKYEQALALKLRDEAANNFAELQRKAEEKEKKKRDYKPRY
ncbi:MAG: TRAP transporter TatT component family protein, partial [candidate division KSB1 bacterium]